MIINLMPFGKQTLALCITTLCYHGSRRDICIDAVIIFFETMLMKEEELELKGVAIVQ